MHNNCLRSPAPAGTTKTADSPIGLLWTLGSFSPYSNTSLASHLTYCTDSAFAAAVRTVDEEERQKIFGGLSGNADAVLDVFRRHPSQPLTVQQIHEANGQSTDGILSGIEKLMKRGIVGQSTPVFMILGTLPWPSSDGTFCLVNDAIALLPTSLPPTPRPPEKQPTGRSWLFLGLVIGFVTVVSTFHHTVTSSTPLAAEATHYVPGE